MDPQHPPYIFSPEQVAILWTYQFGPWRNPFDKDRSFSECRHPFTCPHRSDSAYPHPKIGGDTGVLIPIVRGWICTGCNYTQTWAHNFMLDGGNG